MCGRGVPFSGEEGRPGRVIPGKKKEDAGTEVLTALKKLKALPSSQPGSTDAPGEKHSERKKKGTAKFLARGSRMFLTEEEANPPTTRSHRCGAKKKGEQQKGKTSFGRKGRTRPRKSDPALT